MIDWPGSRGTIGIHKMAPALALFTSAFGNPHFPLQSSASALVFPGTEASAARSKEYYSS